MTRTWLMWHPEALFSKHTAALSFAILFLTGFIWVLTRWVPGNLPLWVLCIVPVSVSTHLPAGGAPAATAALCLGLSLLGPASAPSLAGDSNWTGIVDFALKVTFFGAVVLLLLRGQQHHARPAADERHLSESRFHQLADRAAVLIWMSDTTKGCTWFNKPWLEFVGRSMEQELGTGWTDNVHPDDFHDCMRLYEEAFDTRREFKMEYRLRRHDGAWRWILDHGLPQYDADGAFAGYVGSCIDITDFKRSESALRESEARLAGIIESAMDAIITIDDMQRITDFNSAAEQMFGRSIDSILGKSIACLIPERFRAAHAAHITTFGQTSITRRQMGALGTIYGLRANGEEFPIEASISQLQVQGSKFYTVILRDISQRMNAEQALKASEQRFREITESLPQLVWTSRADGSCDYLSPQWVRYTGIPAEHQLGSGWLEQVHPDDRNTVMADWGSSIVRGSALETEFRICGADGQYRWFQTRAIPLHDERGHIQRWFGTNTDIHDRKVAEVLQGRLGAIVESSDDAIISMSRNGTIQTWNKGAELMFGYPAEDMIGRSILTIIPEERREAEADFLARIAAAERLDHAEAVYVRKDGSPIDVAVTLSPVKDARGTIVAISKIARDITARKRAELTLRQQSQLIQQSHEPILTWDFETGVIEWNRGCELLYGYTKQEAVGQPSQVLLQTVFPFPYMHTVQRLETEGEWTGELHHIAKGGREVVVESRWSLLKTGSRRLVLETNRDVTERKVAEQTLLKKNKDLETLLFVTSHDLKEPLRAIESFSLLVQDRYGAQLDARGRDYLNRVVRAAQRLDQLLTDILELSRAQRMDPAIESIDGEVLVKEALQRLEIQVKVSGADVRILPGLPRLKVNRIWAIQGLYNLLSNAIKYVTPGATPEIEVAPYQDANRAGRPIVGLIVRDRGPGVPPESRDRIFQLFQRAVGREVEGTGAGLAIVRQVAERHGGHAWMQPREGGGSEFVITFGAAP